MKRSRFIGLTVAATVLAVAAPALPAEARQPDAPSAVESAAALSSHGDLKATTVAPSADVLEVPSTASTPVVLNRRSAEQVSIGLPGADSRDDGILEDGVRVYRSSTDDSSVVVNPTPAGVQLATVLGSSRSQSRYTYALGAPAGSEVLLDDDGGASVVDEEGEPLVSIEAPWARDANGEPVPTRFEVSGPNRLTQIVDHTSGAFEYPITADPKVFRCDFWTATCVKFRKKETKSISRSIAGKAAYATAVAICSKIPNAVAGVACVAVVTPYALALGRSFRSAAKKGKCVEVHFLRPNMIPFRWKTERC